MVVEQTDLWVVAQHNLSQEILPLVHQLRGELKAYIALHPEFGASLSPVDVPPNATAIVRAMAAAARRCNVGPMAAVAGAMAQFVAKRFEELSPNIIVENGGDIALRSTRERVVGLLSDPTSDTVLGLRLGPTDFPTCICSSSATIGHSLSLGRGELVVVRSRDGCLADAAATALCNILHGKQDLETRSGPSPGMGAPGAGHGRRC